MFYDNNIIHITSYLTIEFTKRKLMTNEYYSFIKMSNNEWLKNVCNLCEFINELTINCHQKQISFLHGIYA